MARLPNYATLFTIAGGCGIGVGSMMLLTQMRNDNFANQAFFVKRAIDIAKEQPEVKRQLGNKFQVGKATFSDGWSKLRTLNVQVRLPIKGEHDNAYLFAYARKKHEKDKLKLFKLEATFEKIANKKLVILDRADKDDDDEEELPLPSQVAAADNSKEQEKKTAKPLTKEDFKQQMKSWAHK